VTVALVAAVARNGVIGRDGVIPWRIPEDVAHFKELTTGHAVVMGRRTWDSLPERFRPLPGRRNVVVTRNADWRADDAERAGSIDEALALLGDDERVFVIGGADIYAEALPLADEMFLTEIDDEVAGDTFFPYWDRNEFVQASRDEHVSDDGVPFAFVTYRRHSAERQLAALTAVDALLAEAGVDYWLFGGWAVDFHAGSITRPHSDVDIAVWLDDLPRIAGLLEDAGWRHSPEPDEDGGTGYERGGVRLELTFLVRADGGRVVTPLRTFEAVWPEDAFGDAAGELEGVRARLVGLGALTRGKSTPREDPVEAARDRADFDVLSGLGGGR
jgi:dihydrofolate reductase